MSGMRLGAGDKVPVQARWTAGQFGVDAWSVV